MAKKSKKAADPIEPLDGQAEPVRKPLPAAHRRAYRAACSSLRSTLNAMAHYDPAEPTVSGLAELVGDVVSLYRAAVGRDDDYAVTLLAALAEYGVTVDLAKLRARVAELDRPRVRELS